MPKSKLSRSPPPPINISSLKYESYNDNRGDAYGVRLTFTELASHNSESSTIMSEQVQIPESFTVQIIKFPEPMSFRYTSKFTNYYKFLYENKANHNNILRIVHFSETVLSLRQIKELRNKLPKITFLESFLRKDAFFPCNLLKHEEYWGTLDSWILDNSPLSKLQLAQNPLRLMELLKLQVGIVQGLLDGLTYLHRDLNFVHGSIGPEDIVFASPHSKLPVKLFFGGNRLGVWQGLWEEFYSKEGTMEGDIFAAGITIMQITQLLSSPIKHYTGSGYGSPNFVRVEEHALIANVKELIIGMTPSLGRNESAIPRIIKIEDAKLQIRCSQEVKNKSEMEAEEEEYKLETGQNNVDMVARLANLIEDPEGHVWLKHLTFYGDPLGKGPLAL
ncbi:Calcium-dependent protein kinase 1 [Folsomia candida]|uniref:Calcium-dependent protein kinase 1 n=1 Tax=Folsomia candida TaxID=158441 RepID=A0A226DQQ5_FOLCA|nr:Calcium-dependent protein kinase 1 [Folsomia candida]